MNKKFLWSLRLFMGFALLFVASSPALSDEFYKGKIIRFIVGLPPGGGYDKYTRAVARHIGKHIPGNPKSIVQNMVGAGGVTAANYIYSRAKPDGLTVGVWPSGLVLSQALGDRAVKFKADQFGWIGAPSKGLPTCAVLGFTGLKTLQDVLDSKKPIQMGGTFSGLVASDFPKILNLTLGTRFEVISGYEGTARLLIAMQTRQVDGACFGWESMRVTARVLLDAKGDNKLIPFLTHGDSQDPEVKGLPRPNEVIKGAENRDIVNTYLYHFNFFRPFMLPPGIPKERLSIMRRAFEATLEDPQFLADAKRSKLAIDYASGEEIEKFVDEILAISPKTKESLQFLISKKEK